jgi:hypothetical protein
MAVAPFLSSTHDFTTALDELLFDICEEIQLSATRHEQAVQRYETLGDVLEREGSPFRLSWSAPRPLAVLKLPV